MSPITARQKYHSNPVKTDGLENKDSPAFPCTKEQLNAYPGLTKREWMAASALQGLFSDSRPVAYEPKERAKMALDTADCIMKLLDKQANG